MQVVHLAAITTALVYMFVRIICECCLVYSLDFLLHGAVSVLQWAILPIRRIIRNGKQAGARRRLSSAASLLALKLGVAFGGAALGWILNAYGYAADTQLDAVAIKGICLSMSVYAAIPALLAGGLMLFYPLSNKKMSAIEADLMKRREQNKLVAK
jgi:GPH family glycoside/pentoside/hexuronide:cation symporter